MNEQTPDARRQFKLASSTQGTLKKEAQAERHTMETSARAATSPSPNLTLEGALPNNQPYVRSAEQAKIEQEAAARLKEVHLRMEKNRLAQQAIDRQQGREHQR
ncbi:MAG: hypothetical protein IPG64_07955 [Haliea sp.]|nr:hypothetical protein [Haliea sp.]MBK6737846.1 hypothetical protein [Haliea sp.]